MATKTKLNPVTNYLKNVTKSMSYAAADISKDLMPNVGEFTSANKEFLKTTYATLKNPRSALKKSVSAIQNSKIYQALDYGVKNTFEDLRTGNFYNMERINRDEVKLAGFDMDDMNDFSEFGVDNDWESKLNEKPVKKNEITDGDMKIINAVEGSSAANASATVNAVIKASDYQVKSSRANFGQLYMQNERLFSGLHQDISVVGATVESIHKITSASLQNIDKNMSDFFTTELKLSQERNAMLKEMLEIQRNMYTSAANKEKAENDKSRAKTKRNRWSDVQFNGIADFDSYFEVIKKNVGNTIAGLGIPAFNENSNMLATMMTSPLKGITHAMLNAVIPATVKAATKEFDNMLSGIFGHGIARLANAKSSNSGGIFGFLAKIFGINTSVNFSIDTAKYEKGPVPFDGITRKAIIDVIPTYLRRIEAHLTGKPEQTFNYSSGRWVTLQSVKKDLDDIKKNMISRGTSNIRELMAPGIRATKQSNKYDRESFNNALEEFWQFLTDRNGIFNPNASAEKNNISAAKYPALYKNYEIIRTLFSNAGYTETMDKKGNVKKFNRGYDKKVKLSSDVLEAKDSAEKAVRALEETSTALQQYYSALGIDTHGKWNKGKDKFNATNNVLMVKDKLGNTIFDYLKNINTELVWWRTSAYEEIYSNLASINFGSGSGYRGRSSKSRRRNRNNIGRSQLLSQARRSNRNNRSYESILNSNILENRDQIRERESRQKRINDTDEQTKRKILDAINKGEAIDTSVLNDEQIKEYLVALIAEANSESYKNELEGYDSSILKGLRSHNIKSYKQVRELRKKQEKEEEKDNEKDVEEKKQTFIEKAISKVKQGAGIGESIIGATGEVISNMLMSANKAIYEMMYKAEIEDDDKEEGKKKYNGFMDMIQKKITGTFDGIKKYFKDNILDPVKKWLGIDTNDLKSRFTTELKTIGKDLWKNFTEANKELWGPLLGKAANTLGLKNGKTPAQEARANNRKTLLGDMDSATKITTIYDPNFVKLLTGYGLNPLDYGTNVDAAVADIQKEIRKRYLKSTNNLSEFSNKAEYTAAFKYLEDDPDELKEMAQLLNTDNNINKVRTKVGRGISYRAGKSIGRNSKEEIVRKASEEFGFSGSREDRIKLIKDLDPNADVSRLDTDDKLALKYLRLVNRKGTYAKGTNGAFVTGPALLSKGEYVIDKTTGRTGIVGKTDLYNLGNSGTAVVRNPNSGTTARGDTDKEKMVAKKYGIKGYADGTVDPKVTEVTIGKNKLSSETIMNEAKKNLPEGLAGGLVGSLLMSFVGLPLTGMVLGAGSSIIKNSTTLSDQLFGKKNEKGERDNSGVINKKVVDAVKKYSPDMFKYGLAGIIPGLLVAGSPFGAVGGLLLGGTIGYLKNNERFTNRYFGEQGKLSIKSKEKQILQDLAPGAAKGALAGIASHIFLIPKLLPGLSLGSVGLVGAMLLGSGIGMAVSTEEFRNAVLGVADKDGNRDGGLLGAIKDSFAPLAEAGVEFKDKLLGTLDKNIMEPLSQFVQPFIHELPRIAGWLPNKINDLLEKHFGRSLGSLFKDFIGKPIGGLISKVAMPVVGAAANVITSPVRLLGAAGKKIRKNQIKDHRADYMTAKERIAWSMDNKGEVSTFDQAMAGIGSGVEGTLSVDQAKELRDSLNIINDSKASLAINQKSAEREIDNILSSVKGTSGKDISSYDRRSIKKALRAGNIGGAKQILMQNDLSESMVDNLFSDKGLGLDSKMKKYISILDRKKAFSKITDEDRKRSQESISKTLKEIGLGDIDLNDEKSRNKLLANLNTEITDREANGDENAIEPIEKVNTTAEKINSAIESFHKTVIDLFLGNTDGLKERSDQLQADIDKTNEKHNEKINKRKEEYLRTIGEAKFKEYESGLEDTEREKITQEDKERMIKEFGNQYAYKHTTDENGDVIYETDENGNLIANDEAKAAIDYATGGNGKSGFQRFSEEALEGAGNVVGGALKSAVGVVDVGTSALTGAAKAGAGIIKAGTGIVGGIINKIPTSKTRAAGRFIQKIGNKIYSSAENVDKDIRSKFDKTHKDFNEKLGALGSEIMDVTRAEIGSSSYRANKSEIEYGKKYGNKIVATLLGNGIKLDRFGRLDKLNKWYAFDDSSIKILTTISDTEWKKIYKFLKNGNVQDFCLISSRGAYTLTGKNTEYLLSLSATDLNKLKNCCNFYLSGDNVLFGGAKKYISDFGNSFEAAFNKFGTDKKAEDAVSNEKSQDTTSNENADTQVQTDGDVQQDEGENTEPEVPGYGIGTLILDGLSAVGKGLWTGVKTVGGLAWKGAKALGKAAWKGAKALGKKAVGVVGKGAKAIGSKINDMTGGVLKKALDGVGKGASNIFNGIKDTAGKLKKVDKIGPGPNDYGIIKEKNDGSFEPDTSDSKTKEVLDRVTKSEKEENEAAQAQIKMEEQMSKITTAEPTAKEPGLLGRILGFGLKAAVIAPLIIPFVKNVLKPIWNAAIVPLWNNSIKPALETLWNDALVPFWKKYVYPFFKNTLIPAIVNAIKGIFSDQHADRIEPTELTDDDYDPVLDENGQQVYDENGETLKKVNEDGQKKVQIDRIKEVYIEEEEAGGIKWDERRQNYNYRLTDFWSNDIKPEEYEKRASEKVRLYKTIANQSSSLTPEEISEATKSSGAVTINMQSFDKGSKNSEGLSVEEVNNILAISESDLSDEEKEIEYRKLAYDSLDKDFRIANFGDDGDFDYINKKDAIKNQPSKIKTSNSSDSIGGDGGARGSNGIKPLSRYGRFKSSLYGTGDVQQDEGENTEPEVPGYGIGTLILDGLSAVGKGLWTGVKTVGGLAWKGAKALGKAAWKGAKALGKKAVGVVGKGAKAIGSKINDMTGGVLKKALDGVGKWASNIFNGIKDTAGELKKVDKIGQTSGQFNINNVTLNENLENNNLGATLEIIEKAKQGQISIFSNTYWANLDRNNTIAAAYNAAMKVMAIPSIVVRDTMRTFLSDTEFMANEFRNSKANSSNGSSSNMDNLRDSSSGLQFSWSIDNNALDKRALSEDIEDEKKKDGEDSKLKGAGETAASAAKAASDAAKKASNSSSSSGKGKYGRGLYSKQIDPKISSIRFNSSGDSEYQTIGDSGCGPAAAVNAIESMYGRSKGLVNAARFALRGGYKERNGGTRPEFFRSYFASKGYSSQTTSNRNTLINNIRAGVPTVLMGQDKHGVSDSTPYGRNPHYVTATGVDSKGRVIIQDPESRYDNQLYSMNDVLRKTSFGVSAFGRGKYDVHVGHSRAQVKGIKGPTKFTYKFGTGLKYEKIAKQDLGKFSKLTAADMNKAIKEINSSSPFNGHGDIFIEASQKTGLDPRYILAHAAWESAWGTSAIARDKGNYFGIGAFDNSAYESAYTFDSEGGSKMRGGIIGGAVWIKKHYYDEGQRSLYDMIYGKKQYATAADDWINGISSIMNSCPENTDASLAGSEFDVTSSSRSASSSNSSSSSSSSKNKKSYPGIFNMLRSYLNNSRVGRVFNSILGNKSSDSIYVSGTVSSSSNLNDSSSGLQFSWSIDNNTLNKRALSDDKNKTSGESKYGRGKYNKEVWWYLKKKMGLSDAGAAGVIANMEDESGVDPGILSIYVKQATDYTDESFTKGVNNGSISKDTFVNADLDPNGSRDSYGYGLVQWYAKDRKKALYERTVEKKIPINDLSAQLDFIKYETTQERPDRYANMIKVLKTTNDPAKAASIFNEVFEVSGVAPVSRQNKAKKIYEELKGTDGTAITGSTYSGVSSSSSSSSSSSNSGSTKKSYPGIFNMLRSYLNNSRAGRVFNSLLGSSSSSNGPTYSTDSSSSSELSLDDTDTEEKEKDTEEKESTKDSKNKEEASFKDIGKAASDAAKKATSGSGKYIMPISRYGRGEELVPQIWKYLRGKGFTEAGVAGILGNMECESSFNLAAVGDNGTSFGLCQWHNARGDAMKKTAGSNWNSNLKGQLDYLVSELKTSYPSLYKTLTTTNSVKEAASQMVDKFEVCQGHETAEVQNYRSGKANKWFKKLTGKEGEDISGASSTSDDIDSATSSSGYTGSSSTPGIFNMLRSYLNNSRAGRVFNSLLGDTSGDEESDTSSDDGDGISGGYAHATSGDAKAVIQNAVNEIGYVADPSSTQHNKYNAFYANNFSDDGVKKAKDATAVDWCANFVTWVLRHSGVSTETVPNYSCVNMGVVTGHGGKKVSPSEVYPGDLLFTAGNGHTGIVLGKIGNTIHTIEGNNDPYRVHIVSSRTTSTGDNFARPAYKKDGRSLSAEKIYQVAKPRSDTADAISNINDPNNPLKEHESRGYSPSSSAGSGSNGIKPLSKYGRFKSSLIEGDTTYVESPFEMKKRHYNHEQYLKRESIHKNRYGKGSDIEIINTNNTALINTIIKILYTIADNTDKLNLIVSILNNKLGVNITANDVNSKTNKATLKQKLLQSLNTPNMITATSKINNYVDNINDNGMNSIIQAMNAIASE